MSDELYPAYLGQDGKLAAFNQGEGTLFHLPRLF